jgi:hypothetical protein
MTTFLRPLLAIAALFVLSGAAQANGNESLYNPKAAQKLDTSKLSIFGPKAGKFRYDKRMIRAAEIAADRARRKSTSRCWRYVKKALLASETIDSYPKTVYAKQAAAELTQSYGFKQLKVSDPYKAPLGSVLVYGGRGAGHVEIRTANGFVSDFETTKASPRPLIGVFVKPPA